MRNEADLQAWFIKKLNEKGAYTQKVMGVSRRGFPDVLVIYKSNVFFVEIKQKTGVVSSFQKREIRRILRAGGHAFVLFDRSGCELFIENITKELIKHD